MHHLSSQYPCQSLTHVVTLSLYWSHVSTLFIFLYIYWWVAISLCGLPMPGCHDNLIPLWESSIRLPAHCSHSNYILQNLIGLQMWIQPQQIVATRFAASSVSARTHTHTQIYKHRNVLFSLHFEAPFNLKSNPALRSADKQHEVTFFIAMNQNFPSVQKLLRWIHNFLVCSTPLHKYNIKENKKVRKQFHAAYVRSPCVKDGRGNKRQ